jgi:hypothetical protein
MVPIDSLRTSAPGDAIDSRGRSTWARIKILAALTLSALCLAAGLSAGASQANVNVYGITAGAAADFDQCNSQVSGNASTFTDLGSQGVWAYVYAWDWTYRRWNNAGAWVPADGIHQFVINGMYTPYPYAYVLYARYAAGAWRYAAEYVPISSNLDNGFCR